MAQGWPRKCKGQRQWDRHRAGQRARKMEETAIRPWGINKNEAAGLAQGVRSPRKKEGKRGRARGGGGKKGRGRGRGGGERSKGALELLGIFQAQLTAFGFWVAV